MVTSKSTIRTFSRPWQALYGVRIHSTKAVGARDIGVSEEEEQEQEEERVLSLIEQLLPEELLLECFQWLPFQSLAMARCVCTQWNRVGDDRRFWKSACKEVFCLEPWNTVEEEYVQKMFPPLHCSWKNMYLDRPHVRFDGMYVSRNTYIRTGIPEWKVKNPVHLVCYYRYLRFLPDGRMMYRTSPMVLRQVAKSFLAPDAAVAEVFLGKFKLVKHTVYTAFMYPNSFSTEVRSKLTLRSTSRGAFNRLDIDSIVSYDRERGVSVPMMHPVDSDDAILGEKRVYKRGVEPYVFVSWSQVDTHMINKPVHEMDIFIAG